MKTRSWLRGTAVLALTLLITFPGCERDISLLEPATFPTNADIFLDEFGPGMDYQAFGGSKLDALSIDPLVKYQGTNSMKFSVPSVGDPSGFFAGGAFVSESGRDLSGFDALTFWMKASTATTVGVVGFGNDNTGTSQFVAEMRNVPVTTTW